MKNKILAIQGDNLKLLKYENDTTIFLAYEAQKQGAKIFYYEPKNIFIKNNKIYADGNFTKFYNKKKFFKLLGKKTINLERSNYLLVRQDPPFNMNYITTTYFLDRLKTVKIINNPTSIRNVSEKLYSHEFKKYMPSTIFTSRISDIIAIFSLSFSFSFCTSLSFLFLKIATRSAVSQGTYSGFVFSRMGSVRLRLMTWARLSEFPFG